MRASRAVLSTLLSLGLALGVVAAVPSATVGATTGTIAGHVIDDAHGWDMGYLRVTAYVDTGSGWEFAATVYEPSSGDYQLTGLAPGTYRVRIQNQPGYFRSEWYADAASLETASDVTVTADGTTTVNAALAPSTLILGRVTGPAGYATDTSVLAYRNVSGSWAQVGTVGFPDPDSAGSYTIGDLTPGTYRVCALTSSFYLGKCYGGPSVETATDIAVTAEAAALDIDLQLDTASYVTGVAQVWDAIDGRHKVAGATVTAHRLVDGAWQPVGSYVSEAGDFDYGEFAVGGLTPGTYRLSVAPPEDYAQYYKVTYWPDSDTIAGAEDIVVPAGGGVQDITITLQPSVTYTLVQAPTLSGTPQVGKPLRATPGTWTPTPEDITYTWLADGKFAAETTGLTWTPTVRQVGKRISLTATADGLHVPYNEVTTAETAPVAAAPVVNRTLPTISGYARVGRTLRVSAGQWTPARVTLRYKWLANGIAIRGATGSSYALKAAQRGKRIAVRVTASATSYRSTTITTKRTATVTR